MNDSLELRITGREPFADGHSFGDAGPYERLVGRARFAVDPDAPAYADVVDLDRAPRNSAGLVEYTADVCMLKPAGPGNRRLFFGYGNRGNKRELQFFNDAPASNDPRTLPDAGNGFLMRRGYTVVWAAWEGDLLPGDGRMLLDVPVARGGAEPLTGLVRTEFIADRPGITTYPLSGWVSTRSYPAASLDTSRASLTRRRYPGDPREPVAGDRWAFARVETGVGLDAQGAESALLASDMHIHVFDGFEPGWIYELVYTARESGALRHRSPRGARSRELPAISTTRTGAASRTPSREPSTGPMRGGARRPDAASGTSSTEATTPTRRDGAYSTG